MTENLFNEHDGEEKSLESKRTPVFLIDSVRIMHFITQFVTIINLNGFPCTGDDSSFIIIKFHTISSAPTANGINARH